MVEFQSPVILRLMLTLPIYMDTQFEGIESRKKWMRRNRAERSICAKGLPREDRRK